MPKKKTTKKQSTKKTIEANVEGVSQRITPAGTYLVTATLKTEGQNAVTALKEKLGEKVTINL